MVVVTTRPRRKPNTTSNAFGVERKDSLTLVTSWIASAAHQTGQRPPTGHTAVDLADTGTGTCSQRWVTGAHGETASPKNCGSLTGSPSIAHARSTVVECSEGTSTGPAHRPWIRSLAQSASRFTTPFFPPLPGRPIARVTRPIPLLVAPIAPGVVAVGTRGWPARLDPLGHVLRVPTRARASYSVTAQPRRLGSATFCIRLEARDTSHEVCCDSSTRTAPESGAETLLRRCSSRYASVQPHWLPCPSSLPPKPHPNETETAFRPNHERHVKINSESPYSVTAPLRRLGSATFCIRLEARDTSHEACCDSSTRTAPESGAETLLRRCSSRYASVQPHWLPCPSSLPPKPHPNETETAFRPNHERHVKINSESPYSVTAPLRRLGSATFCIRLEARDTSHEACCDSSTRTAPESG